MSETKRSAEAAGLDGKAAEKRARVEEEEEKEAAELEETVRVKEEEEKEAAELEEAVRLYRTLMTGQSEAEELVDDDEYYDRETVAANVAYMRDKKIELKVMPYAGFVATDPWAPQSLTDAKSANGFAGAIFVRNTLVVGASYCSGRDGGGTYDAHFMYQISDAWGKGKNRRAEVTLQMQISDEDLHVDGGATCKWEIAAWGSNDEEARAIEEAVLDGCSRRAHAFLGSFVNIAPCFTVDEDAAAARLNLVHRFPLCVAKPRCE